MSSFEKMLKQYQSLKEEQEKLLNLLVEHEKDEMITENIVSNLRKNRKRMKEIEQAEVDDSILKPKRSKVLRGYDYFAKNDDDFWVHVYDVKDGTVYFNIADKDYTQGTLSEEAFLEKYINNPIDGTDENCAI